MLPAVPMDRVVIYSGKPFPVKTTPSLPRAPESWCDHRPLRMTETCPVFREPVPLRPSIREG